MEKKVKIAIFASGRGSNAQSIVAFSREKNSHFEVTAILSNRREAGVLDFARQSKIELMHFGRNDFYNSRTVLDYLLNADVQLIVLAGFLWLVPEYLIHAFPGKILNIHPALLPKYGGKGMYGHYIHNAVKKNEEKESGITIHFADQEYDKGNIIFQTKCQIREDDNSETIALSVLKMEHYFYPRVIDGIAGKLAKSSGMLP